MSKEIYISSTPHETRLAIVENDDLTEMYYERENEYTLAGSIYNGKVTRVLPGMQSSFVDLGLERDAFLYITDFMEEAGDSADFDATSAGSRGSEGRRNERSRDSSRDEAAALPSDSAPSSEVSSSRVARAAQPGDGRSGDSRSGDRNRRRRGGHRDGRAGEDRSSSSDTRFTAGDSRAGVTDSRSGITDSRSGTGEFHSRDIFPAPPARQAFNSSDAPGASGEFVSEFQPPAHTGDADLGEGAPGADGSRRWRGRRGRRRGRGGNRPLEGELSPESTTPSADPSDLKLNLNPDLAPDVSAGYDLDETASFDAAADSTWSDQAPSSLTPLSDPSEVSSFESRSPRDRAGRDRGGRDRGGRDRSGRGSDRGADRGSDRNADRSPRVPRGFTPSRALYGVEDVSEQQPYGVEPAAPAEPIILPGEVLSKYRQGGEAASPSGASPASPAPAPDFSLTGAWDGGSVLPGETLRPRAAASEPQRQEGRRDENRRGGRNDRSGRGERKDRNDRRAAKDSSVRSDSTAGHSEPQQERQASLAPAHVVPFANTLAPVEPDLDGLAIASPQAAQAQVAEAAPAMPAPAEPTPKDLNAVAPAAHHAEIEYEPTEGSASHRFDPAPPREFRQAAPDVPEPQAFEAFASQTPIAEATQAYRGEQTPAAETFAPGAASTHSVTPPPGSPLAPLHSDGDTRTDAPATLPLASAEAPIAAHDFTSLTSEGEMLSADPAPPPAGEVAEPSSPLQHETAILHAAAEPELSPEPLAAASADLGQTPDQPLDEVQNGEESEEDFHTTTLHAASIEEMDYEEEDDTEVIEPAADLGSILRDMSIDQLTSSSEPHGLHDHEEEGDDEFDFEEEDTTEDGSFHDAFTESAESDLEDYEDHGDVSTDEPRTPLAAEGETIHGGPSLAEDSRNDRRRGGRRDGRRGGRDRNGDRDRSADRARISGDRSGERSSGSRPGRRDGRHSAQTTNLPAISDLLKPGQEVLVQIAKEPIAKKGARITSHIALPGRFLVFMPTVNHTGVSRKIESDGERRRLKEILLSEKGEASGGFIVRTAAAGASEEELRSDLRFLLNLWADIKQRSESSKSPALIYHDLNLVERILRDQVTDNFSAIWVDTETEYERVLRFLQRFQPSLIRRVKLYTKETPMYEQFGITEEINKALRSKVWLKSGGSIVINQTEALVAIDINTGKYVGKTARLEDTIVKTNLDAIPEIVRQIRLRDLGGIIIIDFIDMDERKNRHKVMAVLEEELKKDRAPSKVLQFNDFGLVAITRKRVKQSLERTLSTTCGVCAGTGMVKSAVTVCNDIYIEMRKMQKHLDRGDVMLRVNPEVVKQLKSPTARWLQEMEEMVGKTILVKSDPALHPEQFDIH